jgi:hypothetical protein
MSTYEIRRIFEAERDIPKYGIKRGEEVVELSNGVIRRRFQWGRLIRDLGRMSKQSRLSALQEAAELEAAVTYYLKQQRGAGGDSDGRFQT